MDIKEVKFIKTISSDHVSEETGELVTLEQTQEDNPGAIIHTHDDNGDDTLYIGSDQITDKLNMGDDYNNLDGETIQVGNFKPLNYGELKGMTVSEILREMFRPIGVQSIDLNKTSVSLKVGESTTLTATVTPSNATNKTVTWSSLNDEIAIVSNSGTVTAKKVGTTKINVSAGGKEKECTITVEPTPPSTATQPSASISYSGDKLITVGSSLPLESAITATINDGKWSGAENANVPYAGGHSIELSITKDGTPVEFGGIAEEGTYTISGVVTFTPGGSPMDNDNPPTEYPAYPGGTINTNTITVKVIYPIYINGYLTREGDDSEDITVMRRYDLDYNNPQELEITIPDETYSERLAIYVPYEFSELHLYKYDPIRSDINENNPPESWTVNYIPNETAMTFVDDEISEYPGYGKYIKDIEVDSSYSGKALYKIIFEK